MVSLCPCLALCCTIVHVTYLVYHSMFKNNPPYTIKPLSLSSYLVSCGVWRLVYVLCNVLCVRSCLSAFGCYVFVDMCHLFCVMVYLVSYTWLVMQVDALIYVRVLRLFVFHLMFWLTLFLYDAIVWRYYYPITLSLRFVSALLPYYVITPFMSHIIALTTHWCIGLVPWFCIVLLFCCVLVLLCDCVFALWLECFMLGLL